MDHPNPHVNLALVHAAIFNGKCFANAEDYSRYLLKFQDRPLCPSVSLAPSAFNRYDMNIPSLINAIGWTDVLMDQHFGFCPEAVRMFYSNMRPCYNTHPPSFTTIVFNFLITINVNLLSQLLGIPINGAEVMDETDFQDVGFNEVAAIRTYMHDTGRYYPSALSSGRLPDDLKVLHFYITRVFLPRSHGLTTVSPSDLWIMASAKENRAISYPHLMFDHMMRYHDDNYAEELPFAPQITLMLRSLGIDLRYKVSRVNLIDQLHAQFVLRRVDASVGRRGPRVNVPGGDSVAADEVVPALEDGLSLADLVEDNSDKGKQKVVLHHLEFIRQSFNRENEASTSGQIPEEPEGSEGDISDYIPSPPYPF
ncbi:unnamed protein product [Linum trigynum]|uniref:Uncharacterized protein n=1 Tax=Linum trigynum TaxID=586398 RepID=A0AAV2EVV2_9ROSI